MGCGHSEIIPEMPKQITYKMVMLGISESGKSTLYRQLKWLCSNDAMNELKDELFLEEELAKIRENMVSVMILLLKKSHELYERDNDMFMECKINFKNKNIVKDTQYLAKFQNENFIRTFKTEDEIKLLGESIYRLWKLKEIQKTFQFGPLKYALIDNMEYYFQRSIDIFKPRYECTKKDVLLKFTRSTGIYNLNLQVNISDIMYHFRLIMYGGLRGERNKWCHVFSSVDCVLYVAALNNYRYTPVIVFLNKHDLYSKKIKEGHHLSLCFDSTINPSYKGIQWDSKDDTINYNPNKEFKDNNDKMEYLDNCINKGLHFIMNRYRDAVPEYKSIYFQITTLIGKNKTFWDIFNIVIKNDIRKQPFF